MTQDRREYFKQWKRENADLVRASARRCYRRRADAHPLFGAWHGMIARCTSAAHKQYGDYGGRGVTVCDRWRVFANFEADMTLGYQAGHDLHRIDNDGVYAPQNCMWVSRQEHSHLRQATKLTMVKARRIRGLHAAGGYLRRELAERFGVSVATIKDVTQNRSWKE